MIVGIDLGTTNSAVGIWRDGRAELIPNSLGSVLTPSAVSVDDNGEFLVGLAARERQVTHPGSTATAFKRFMGSNRTTMLGANHSLRPEELSALVLRSLKADAEIFLGEPVAEAVITVPAYFNDKQRKATRRAGELAGFKVERLVNEPTAAALAYGIHELANESRFLVFDLGGGTFDVSILEIFEGVIEVRSSTGDNQLGGEDFNQVLIDEFHAMLDRSRAGWRKTSSPVLFERIREQAERARRQLSTNPVAVMSVAWQERLIEHEVTTERFEVLCATLLERLREPVVRAMRDGKIAAETLKEIVLVGGATRMPIVRRAVTRMFGALSERGSESGRGRRHRRGDSGRPQVARRGIERRGHDRRMPLHTGRRHRRAPRGRHDRRRAVLAHHRAQHRGADEPGQAVLHDSGQPTPRGLQHIPG
jgi:molecular chaperone HscC